MKWLAILLLLTGCAAKAPASAPLMASQQQQAVLRALEAERQGRAVNAAQYWRQAIQLAKLQDDWPAQGRALLGLAQLQIRNGGYEAAAIEMQKMRGNTLYSEEQRAQASLLLARVGLRLGNVDAASATAEAATFCSRTHCNWRAAILNIQARQALPQDPDLALKLADEVLLLGELPQPERSHAQRTRAQALLAAGQLAAAQSALTEALKIDRQLGEPLWLLDDFQLQLEIAAASNDQALVLESRVRIASLCEALAEKVCGSP